MLSRRQLLKAGLILTSACCLPAVWAATTGVRLLSGARLAEGWGVVALDAQGQLLWQLPLPQRVHQVSFIDGRIWAVARRPGNHVWQIDLAGRVLTQSTLPAGLVCAGHICQWQDSLWLTAENQQAQAALLRWQDNNWQLAQQFEVLGPHQLLPYGRYLALAIGGLDKRQDNNPRQAQINSALWLWQGGQPLSYGIPAAGFSLRHLAQYQQQLYVAAQYYGIADAEDHPLVFRLHKSQLQPLAAPEFGWEHCAGYIASIVAGELGVVACAPKAGLWLRWSLDGDYLGSGKLWDVAGGAMHDQQLWLAGGGGDLLHFGKEPQRLPFGFDNHLSVY